MTVCPSCGRALRRGYLFSTKDGALSFADEVPGVFQNAKHAEGFVKLTDMELGRLASAEAFCCNACRTITVRY